MVLINGVDDIVENFELFLSDFIIQCHFIDEIQLTIKLFNKIRNV
jgi:hypothetical protein